ncbi:glycosyltransferase family 2 protein [Streptacidiphilus sp. 4-A2]|nr:glycosyltransferase family 2 protein [Streptacidiphilus sp. 4-A2]
MPRISVIVPAYQVQAYLGECLDSVLDQSFRDFELIGVDDCSPDGSGEIFDEYARKDERVRVLHLTENVGLGRARNAGIDVATGDYLLFLDSDDTLTPARCKRSRTGWSRPAARTCWCTTTPAPTGTAGWCAAATPGSSRRSARTARPARRSSPSPSARNCWAC